MKKVFFAAIAAFVINVCPAVAQYEVMPISEPAPAMDSTAVDSNMTFTVTAPCKPYKIGTMSYSTMLQSLPAYQEAMKQLEALTGNYKTETAYNETNFKRKFSEYLQGQKDFPQNILLKRQKDLQEEMEKAMAFRMAADSLLHQAKVDMLAPIKAELDAAIRAVGMERGYMEIVNTDIHSHLFIHPELLEDATPYVLERLNAVKE